MVRTQVQLTERQLAAIRRMARERGVSIAAVVREAVDRAIEAPAEQAERARALAVVGKYGSGTTDVSADHDRHLEEAYRG